MRKFCVLLQSERNLSIAKQRTMFPINGTIMMTVTPDDSTTINHVSLFQRDFSTSLFFSSASAILKEGRISHFFCLKFQPAKNLNLRPLRAMYPALTAYFIKLFVHLKRSKQIHPMQSFSELEKLLCQHRIIQIIVSLKYSITF